MTYLLTHAEASTPLWLIDKNDFPEWLSQRPEQQRHWASASRYTPDKGKLLRLPAHDNTLSAVIVGIGPGGPDTWTLGNVAELLETGTYHLAQAWDAEIAAKLALGWQLGTYQFTRYKHLNKSFAMLVLPNNVNGAEILRLADATNLARTLITTPADDMGPTALAEAALKIAHHHHATAQITVGDELLTANYPAIHAVGRASDEAPRLIDLRWGKPEHPRITLVGKGVCFDSGGLDIKPSGNMRLMKKDMGGAAIVLALAQLMMESALPVCLRVLIPAVENSIAGNAFRPGDVIATRKGLSVEIDNTDAEGRLILCDALWEASSEGPDLLIDCATLTGAARIALGTDIPAVFSGNDALARQLMECGRRTDDPVWQLPLWDAYREQLDSPIADLANASASGYGGAITAALYLKEFVVAPEHWLHLDMMAWNTANRPGRPLGGEASALRALYQMVKEFLRTHG